MLLLFIVFLLRIPSLFEPYWYGDEGVYLTLGLAIKKDLLLYRDIYDNKTPLIYVLAAISNGQMFWFRAILMTSVLTTIYFFHKLALTFFSNQEKPAKAATILLSLATTVRIFEGNIANAEIFILLPTVLGIYLITTHLNQKIQKISSFVFAGLILSLGFLFKVPAVFDFIAVYLFLLFFQKEKKLINFGKNELYLTIAYLVPIIFAFAFFWSKGSLGVYFESTVLHTMGYLTSWKTGSHAFSLITLLKSELVIKGFLVFVITFLLWIRREWLGSKNALIFLWFLFALFAATLSGRPYPHYLIQVLPPLALSFGLVWTKAKKPILIFICVLLISGLALMRYRFWSYSTFSYWSNFIKFATGQEDKNSYFSYFNPELPNIYSIAEVAATYTKPDDKIFVWSDDPYLYPLSKRLPVGRYTVAYHIIEQNRYKETIQAIKGNQTALIIVNNKIKIFPELKAVLANDYLLAQIKGSYSLYLRRQNTNLF